MLETIDVKNKLLNLDSKISYLICIADFNFLHSDSIALIASIIMSIDVPC